MAKGVLIVTSKKQFLIKFTNSKGKDVETAVPKAELSKPLEDSKPREKLNGREVEFDEESGQPKRVRPVGEAFVPPTPTKASQQQPHQAGHRGGGQPQGRPHGQPAAQTQQKKGDFHNPYNFVPALPRETSDQELADRPPIGHHALFTDRYTGVIRVKMTVKTPLLLLDAARASETEAGHKIFPVRVDAEGRPYIPPTSIKGMLRSAYEAITNSRLAVFPGEEANRNRSATGHGARLAFRRPAKIEVTPVIIEECSDTELKIRILTKLWLNSAAKLPRYQPRSRDHRQYRQNDLSDALKYPDGTLPQLGDHVRVLVSNKGCVEKIHRFEESKNGDGLEGWVLVTERNIGNKKYERVFVISPSDQQLIFRNEKALHIRRMWMELVENYQQIHEKDLEKRRQQGKKATDYLGDNPGQTAWSRQVWDKGYKELRKGMLCYARLDQNKREILGIYPVTISRDLYPVSPLSLLHPSLRPATNLAQLSPADRVFGWVNQQGHGAYRGHVRIGPVACNTPKEQAIESFGSPGLPLAILGQPKPQQARFYVAKDINGIAQPNGLSKEKAGYARGKGLRGRKVYPHHNGLPEGFWNNPMEDRTQKPLGKGFFQEYRRPKLEDDEQRDDQNRSIEGWVRPGTEFSFDIHVTNLSKVELGALLWLLSLPDNHYHRFGSGKPLGFGSVRLEIEAAEELYDGAGWQQIYRSLDDIMPKPVDRDALIKVFKKAVVSVYKPGSDASADDQDEAFHQIPFIKAWLRSATGHADGLPTHYPRARSAGQNGPVGPHPKGLAYEWFVANDRTGANGGPALALPNLAEDRGLPILNDR